METDQDLGLHLQWMSLRWAHVSTSVFNIDNYHLQSFCTTFDERFAFWRGRLASMLSQLQRLQLSNMHWNEAFQAPNQEPVV